MKRWYGRAGVVLTVAGAAGTAAPSWASAATWEGGCTIDGESTFERPIGALPRPVRYTDAGTGTCTGRLNGVPVTNTPILLAAEGMGSVGCLATDSIMFGTLTFTNATRSPRDDVRVRYSGEANGSLGHNVSRSRGADDGYGISYVTSRSDPSMARRCQENTVDRVRWTATTQTLTPSESRPSTKIRAGHEVGRPSCCAPGRSRARPG